MDKSKWEYKKLGEVATFLNGYAFKPENWSKHGLKIIRIQNLTDETAPYNHYEGEIDSKYIVRNGDLLISWSATLGAFLWNNDDALLNQHIFKTILDKSDIDKFYLKYCVISKLEEMAKKSHGVTMRHITKKDFDNTIIPYPSLSDQQRIVAELDCLNEMIALKQEQLKEFDKLAQSIFYDMFGDPISNEKGWDKNKLDELYKVTSSKRILQSEWQDNGVPFYKVADIVNLIDGKTVIPSTFIKESTYNELISLGLVPNSGDILITSRGTLGECYIVLKGDKFYFQDGMITWLSQKANNILPIYLKSVFGTKSFLDSLLHNANMSTVAYLSIGQLSKVLIPLPPLALQQQFAEKIQAIEAQKELVKKSIAETQQLLDSRMDYYFD